MPKPSLLAAALLVSVSLVAGCAASSGARSGLDPAPASCSACCPAAAGCVPAFLPDGRLRRDAATDAPVFVAGGDLSALAPRFNDDGTVCRDPETGAPLHEEVSEGRVVRVLVLSR